MLYYPELNRLVPLWHCEEKAHVPAGKSVPVRVVSSREGSTTAAG
jgi:hypothetical protein